MICLEFLTNAYEFRYIRLLSRRHFQNQRIFLRRRLGEFQIPNCTEISNSEISRISIAFSLCVNAINALQDCHSSHRQGMVCGININTGLLFLSLSLRNKKDEMLMICTFDDYLIDQPINGRFWSWTHSYPHPESVIMHSLNRDSFRDTELSRLLNGGYFNVKMHSREGGYFRIKRHDEYFNWKKCKKYSIICASTMVTVVVIVYVMLTAI